MRALPARSRRVVGALVVATLLLTAFLTTFGRPSGTLTDAADSTAEQVEGSKQTPSMVYLEPISALVVQTTPCSVTPREVGLTNTELSVCHLVQVEFQTGQEAGQLYELAPLFTRQQTSTSFEPGQPISVRPVVQGGITTYEFASHSRSGLLVAFLAVGAAVLVLVGKTQGLRVLTIGISALATLHLYALPASISPDGLSQLGTIAAVAAIVVLATILMLDGPLQVEPQLAFLSALTTVVSIAGLGHLGIKLADLGSPLSAATLNLNPLNIEPTAQAYLPLSLTVGTVFAAASICKQQVALVSQLRTGNPKATTISVLTTGVNAGRSHAINVMGVFALASCAAALPLLALFSSSAVTASEALNNELVASVLVRLSIGIIGLGMAAPIATLMAVLASPTAQVTDRSGQIHQPRPTVRRRIDLTQVSVSLDSDAVTDSKRDGLGDDAGKASAKPTSVGSRLRVGLDET